MGTPGGAGTTRLRFAFPPLPSHARRRAPDCAAFSLPGRPTPRPPLFHSRPPLPPPSGPTQRPTPGRFRLLPFARPPALSPFLQPHPSCLRRAPGPTLSPNSPHPTSGHPALRASRPAPPRVTTPRSPLPGRRRPSPTAPPCTPPPLPFPTSYTYTRAARTHASFHALFLPV